MRLALVPPSALTPEQRPLYDDMKAGIAVKYTAFATIRDDGAILNPWSAWLHEPELGTAIWGVTKAMTRFRHLPDVARQIAILVVGSHSRAAYEIYTHSAAARGVGISEAQLEMITTGRRPVDISDEAQTAYEIATTAPA
jgi:hypothetical protein